MIATGIKNTIPTRPVLPYHGGKWDSGDAIVGYLPSHRVYVEPFCGAASVLLKKPRAHSELINDLNDDIGNLFRVLRNESQAARLIEGLYLTPYARSEYEYCLEPCEDPIERARRYISVTFMRFQMRDENDADLRTAFRATNHKQNIPKPRAWASYPQHLKSVVERLRGVGVETKNAIELIPQHDSTETLFYCDPPYVKATRHAGEQTKAYRY